jgi:cation-transporting P-type ATPase E
LVKKWVVKNNDLYHYMLQWDNLVQAILKMFNGTIEIEEESLFKEIGQSLGELQGLTEKEALARRKRGQGNNVHITTGRSYIDIIRYNVFTFINSILFVIGFVMILLGLQDDAFVSVGVVMSNVVVGLVQEIRAKRQLDHIALLTRPKATIIREGEQRVVDPGEIVLGDTILVGAGDQIVVDGVLVGDSVVDLDESLLTGESDLVCKRDGEEVLSGSFCVTGAGAYEATKVGASSFANKLTSRAKVFRVVRTPLQRDINFVVRILLFMATIIGILFGVSFVIHEVAAADVVKASAVIAGLVPAGLILMTTTAYALGALRMVGKGALIQQANAVESMSNVDVLCLDKTGTLTANRIHLHAIHSFGLPEDEFRALLGDYAHNLRSGNRTSDALLDHCPHQTRNVIDEIPFSSARKWSALSMNEGERRGVYVMGAPEMVAQYLARNANIGQEQIDAWTELGMRVLIIAHSPRVIALHDADETPFLPAELQPVGLVSFSDELRDEARETIQKFTEAGIELKIISGDNPETVHALAIQAGLPSDIKVISGVELAGMDEYQLVKVVEEVTIFGRITPEQKEKLVNRLRAQGHYVAMIGDGVNDVLSLKQAQIGIAMQSGSAATRGVADIVLLNDSFAALPTAFMEGQRILNGMEDIIRLFLTRAFYAAFIILGVAVVAEPNLFPFIPKHASLLTLVTVGFPTFAIAAWSRPGIPNHNLSQSILHFILPAALSLAGAALTIYALYLGYYWYPERMVEAEAINLAQTALTTSVIFMGLLLVVFTEPPSEFWVGGDDLSNDWRPTILAGVMFVIYITLLLSDPMRDFFELAQLRLVDFLFIGGTTVVWSAMLRYVWRTNLFEQLLGVTNPETMDLTE